MSENNIINRPKSKLREILLWVTIYILALLNIYQAHQKLKGVYYKKGIETGSERVENKVIEQVRKEGKINVLMPNGRMVTLYQGKEQKNEQN